MSTYFMIIANAFRVIQPKSLAIFGRENSPQFQLGRTRGNTAGLELFTIVGGYLPH